MIGPASRTSLDRNAFYRQLGRRVRRAREAAKLTQGALAALLSISRPSVVAIEKGEQQVLLHTVVELANALDVGIDQLLPPASAARSAAALARRRKEERRWILAALIHTAGG